MPRVKITSVHASAPLLRGQLPRGSNRWGECEFFLDDDPTDNYDYLAVYDEPPQMFTPLACPPQNTILLLTENIATKLYPPHYTRQFGAVLSCQEPFAVRHPRLIRSQVGFSWTTLPGVGNNGGASHPEPHPERNFDTLAAMPPPAKTGDLSTVCSGKGTNASFTNWRDSSVFHAHRLAFTHALKRDLPKLDFFGRDTNPIADKLQAILPYRYHLAIENYNCDHWWTEKLADAFLGYALPIFHGCPNLENDFPTDSFIRINIYNYAEALQTIRHAMANDEYEKRLPAIAEARRRLLYEHNVYALLNRVVASLQAQNPPPKTSAPHKAGAALGNIAAYRQRPAPLRLPQNFQRKMQKMRARRHVRQTIRALGNIRFGTDQSAP